VIKEEF